MKWLDAFFESSARSLARRTSRRSVLAGLGSMLLGAGLVPLLPVARGAEAKHGGAAAAGGAPAGGADPGDPSACEYWRHCAIDGFLCGCCGGSQSMCPPGTDMSLITWIGTCHNPGDNTDYVISYNDCCGKALAGAASAIATKATPPSFSLADPTITTGARETRRRISPIIARPRVSWAPLANLQCVRS